MESASGKSAARPSLSPFARKLFAVSLAIVAATLIRGMLDPWLEQRVLFVTYFVAIAFAAWYGGVWLGVVTAIASYLVADYLFVSPRFGFSVFEWTRPTLNSLFAFVAISATILALTEVLNRANLSIEREAQRAAEQRKLLEVTLSSIGDAVIVTNAERRITFMNGVAESLTGWRYGEINGAFLDDIFQIVNEQTGKTVETPIAKVLETGAIVGLANHTLLISRDGKQHPIDDSAAPIVDEQGQIVGVVLVFRDVTEQRLAQQAVQKLAAIVEHSDDAVIGKNMNGIITSWNAAAERLYGFTAEEAIGQPISLIVPPDHAPELIDIMRRLKAGERIDAWDTVRMRKDGTRVDVSLQISPIKSAEGDIVGASKVARDVSGRKRNEESLAFLADASEALASLTSPQNSLEQVARLSVPFFADWCVVYCLDEAGAMLPVAWEHANPAKRAVLAELLESIPFDVDADSVTSLAFRSGQSQLIEQVPADAIAQLPLKQDLVEKIRALNPRSLVSVPLKIRERTIGVMTFVSAESNHIYDMRDVQFATDLARRAAIAIDNAQLYQSVQEAVRQKDDFLAMLSHELRNPLSAIGYATALGKLSTAEEQGEVFPVIERQVTHLTHLIDDLLDVARVTRHKISLKIEPVDLATIVKHAADSSRYLFDEKRHDFRVEVSHEPMPLTADVTRAEQVIVNLLTNAAKYTPPDGRVTLTAYPEEGSAVLQVTDTGIGLAPEMLPRVFDLFAQADRTLDRSEGGLGVGLTIVRKLVEMLGGSVSVSSAGLGQGAEFVVRLPLSSVPVPKSEPKQMEQEHNTVKPRVLVVDDNLDTARLSAMLLRSQGFEVTTAHDGEEALARTRADRPDVLLLDIGLPRLSGYEVAEALRKEGFPGKLIAVSGYGQSEDRRRSLEAGFNHHLVKPVDHRQLLELLTTAEKTSA
jgi:PAS domain S-box-containing protein